MAADTPTYAPLKRETLAEAVRSEIERRILDGAIPAGEKLNEVLLADAIGVSRGTVREAIRSLSQTGLIELIANRGAYVRQISAKDIANLYELRGAVFAMACAGAASRVAAGAAPELSGALADNMSAMREAADEDEKAAYYALNIQFHDLLMRAADNPRAKGVYDGIVKEMHLFRRRGLSRAGNIQRSIEEHQAIVDAVVAGDAESARAAARIHIETGLKRFLATLAETPGETAASTHDPMDDQDDASAAAAAAATRRTAS